MVIQEKQRLPEKFEDCCRWNVFESVFQRAAAAATISESKDDPELLPVKAYAFLTEHLPGF